MSSTYIRGLIFSWDLVSLYSPVPFLNMWLSGIIAIWNRNGDNTSPRKILLRISVPAKLFPLAINSTLQFLIVSSINLMTLSDILYILRQFIILLCWTVSYVFFQSIHAIATFFVSFCCLWDCVDQCIEDLLFLWLPYGILSVPRRTVRSLLMRYFSNSLFWKIAAQPTFIPCLD